MTGHPVHCDVHGGAVGVCSVLREHLGLGHSGFLGLDDHFLVGDLDLDVLGGERQDLDGASSRVGRLGDSRQLQRP